MSLDQMTCDELQVIYSTSIVSFSFLDNFCVEKFQMRCILLFNFNFTLYVIIAGEGSVSSISSQITKTFVNISPAFSEKEKQTTNLLCCAPLMWK